MNFRSEPGRRRAPEDLQADLHDALHGVLRIPDVETLQMAMRMLQTQIASRRAIIVLGTEDQAVTDSLAREIQERVDRIRLIVAELRRRCVEVEWEE